MKSVNYTQPASLINFLERNCGLNLEDVKITYSLHYVKVECDGEIIVEADGVTEHETWKQAHKQLDSYYQRIAIKDFLPDIVHDLQTSLEKGEVCMKTVEWLKKVAVLLHENDPNNNRY